MERIEVNHFVVKKFQTAEAIKTLRTNLMFSGEGIQTIGLTSFSAAEGKTTIAFQLAASLAQTGKKVILLDADLRKSTLQNRLMVEGKVTGLSHYLIGQANVDEILYETDMDNLYIMFAGTRVPNAAEILGGSRFQKLIQALKKTFDYVIVDATPLGQVIDSAVMAPELDGTILVIDTTHNSYKLERRVYKQLERSGGKILGVVLNRVDMKQKSRYYGRAYGKRYGYGYGKKYGYGYSYGYGYGYGNEREKEETEETEAQEEE